MTVKMLDVLFVAVCVFLQHHTSITNLIFTPTDYFMLANDKMEMEQLHVAIYSNVIQLFPNHNVLCQLIYI